MRKKIQGRKGRPTIGGVRKYNCSDEDFARIQLAAKLVNSKPASISRDGAIEKANAIIFENVEALRSLELTDEKMKQVAAEYLKDH